MKIGIVGSGFGIVGLLPAFSGIRGCTVVAFVTTKAAAAEIATQKYGVKTICKDWKELLAHPELDAVALAVPPNMQYRIAKAALEKGLHVFAEKPLAATLAEARTLLALAKRKKRTHAIDFMFPEIPAWVAVKKMLDRRELGALTHVSVSWDWLAGDIKYARSSWKTSVKDGGGALAFYFSHGFHYLEHFCGPIAKITSSFTHSKRSVNGGEVGVDMLVTFASGVGGNVHVSCVSPGFVRHELTFYCERGVIVLGARNAVVDGFMVDVYTEHGLKRLPVQSLPSKKGEDERVKEVRKVASRFVRAARSGTPMQPSFSEGVRVEELIELARAGQPGKSRQKPAR